MTTTGPCEMSGPSPKFFGAGSKFPYVLYVYSSGPICLSRLIRGGGGGGEEEEEEGVIPLSSQPRSPLSW